MPDHALPAEPLYLPFESGPYRMAMGLTATQPDELICIDVHYPAEIARRRAALHTRREEALALVPGAEPAARELLAHLLDVLPRRYPAWFRVEAGMLHNELTGEAWPADGADPLAVAGLLVQEDLLLLQPKAAGPVLLGGVLCFPSGWRLRDKLGLPLAAVHAPVPLYADRLAKPVDRLMMHLKPGRLAQRLNWSVHDDPSLYRPHVHGRHEINAAVSAENAGQSLFLRVERQTLSLLPRSGAVLFTIRTHVYPLARVAADPAVAARLAEAVRTMPPELALYKSIPPFAGPLLAYLDRRAR